MMSAEYGACEGAGMLLRIRLTRRNIFSSFHIVAWSWEHLISVCPSSPGLPNTRGTTMRTEMRLNISHTHVSTWFQTVDHSLQTCFSPATLSLSCFCLRPSTWSAGYAPRTFLLIEIKGTFQDTSQHLAPLPKSYTSETLKKDSTSTLLFLQKYKYVTKGSSISSYEMHIMKKFCMDFQIPCSKTNKSFGSIFRQF